MKSSTSLIIDNLIKRYPKLSVCKESLENAILSLKECFLNNGKVLVCGNGGSTADSEHIVAELMKGFTLERKLKLDEQIKFKTMFPGNADYFINNLQRAIPAISLTSHTALLTAYANDKSPDLIYAQQVYGYGVEGDILLAISTSGNSRNVVYASQVAKVRKMKVIALTGYTGGKLKELADILINVPSNETFEVQEYHLPLYHALCACLENELFNEE